MSEKCVMCGNPLADDQDETLHADGTHWCAGMSASVATREDAR